MTCRSPRSAVTLRTRRFLLDSGLCLWSFSRRKAPTTLRGYSDTYWAGCLLTRRSTSCSMLFLALHLVGSSSTTQNVVALSFGGKMCSRLLGLRALACGFGRTLSAQVFVDSTACKGLGSRRGVGKIRHLHVQVLWVQTAVQEKRTWVRKTRHQAPGDCSDA